MQRKIKIDPIDKLADAAFSLTKKKHLSTKGKQGRQPVIFIFLKKMKKRRNPYQNALMPPQDRK